MSIALCRRDVIISLQRHGESLVALDSLGSILDEAAGNPLTIRVSDVGDPQTHFGDR